MPLFSTTTPGASSASGTPASSSRRDPAPSPQTSQFNRLLDLVTEHESRTRDQDVKIAELSRKLAAMEEERSGSRETAASPLRSNHGDADALAQEVSQLRTAVQTMSKTVSLLNSEAEATRAHYKKTKDTDSYVQQISDDQWLVYRKGDDKALKSVEYSQTNLAPIVNGATPYDQQTYPEPESLNSVAAFHRLFRCPVVMKPAIPSADRCQLRVSLLEEEVQELADAIKDNDLVEVADALADIQYVLSGAVLEFGMGSIFQTLFDEVQRSNMSKACGTMEEAGRTQEHYRATKGVESTVEEVDGQFLVFREGDRKVIKSVEYSPASLKGILEAEEDNDKAIAPRASPTSVRNAVQ